MVQAVEDNEQKPSADNELVSENDLSELNETKKAFETAQRNFSNAQAMLLKAQGAYEFKQDVITQRYNIGNADSVDLQTGKIVRAHKEGDA